MSVDRVMKRGFWWLDINNSLRRKQKGIPVHAIMWIKLNSNVKRVADMNKLNHFVMFVMRLNGIAREAMKQQSKTMLKFQAILKENWPFDGSLMNSLRKHIHTYAWCVSQTSVVRMYMCYTPHYLFLAQTSSPGLCLVSFLFFFFFTHLTS